MSDNQKPDHETSETLHDEPLLKDSKPPAKWPWILAAVAIIIMVMTLQFGSKLLMNKLTHKKEVANSVLAEFDKNQFKALPIPQGQKKESQPRVTDPQTDVIAYLKAREVSHPPSEIEHLRVMARLEERKKQLEDEARMLESEALLDIGVGTQNQAAVSSGINYQGGSQNPNTAYLNSISNQPIQEVNAGQFGDLRFRIRKGKVLRGVTESAIDSDLPGIIRGHLTEDVYGDQGDIVLLPNGSGLIGEYRSGGINNGQISLFVVWTRVQLSNGIYVTIDSPSSDPLGRAGMTGPVDHHYFQRFGSSLLSSFFSVSVATLGVNSGDRYNSEAAYRQGLSNSFSQTANQEFQQYANIQNTIMPPQGTEITIMVNKDISFEDVLTREEK